MKRICKRWKVIAERMFWCLLASCLFSVIIPVGTARADVLIELNDSFWEKNRGDCRHISRQYTVNSPEGYAILWESPVSSKQREVVLNGVRFWGEWVYTDDKEETWCVVQGTFDGNSGREGVRGWIRLSECLAVPDHISFREAYEQEFVACDPSYDHAFDGVETVKLWKYPCSGVVVADQMSAQWFQEADSVSQMFDVCWKDPKGRMWAYIGYFYGMRNVWICLDDPAGDTIETEEDLLAQDEVIYPPVDPEATGSEEVDSQEMNPEETESPETDVKVTDVNKTLQQDVVIYPPTENPPKVKNGVTGLTIAGVAGVVAVTAGMIWFFFGRKKKDRDDNQSEIS